MSNVLVLLAGGLVVGTALIVVSGIKNVRVEGWNPRRFAPGALRWFLAGLLVLLVSLVGGLAWALPGLSGG